ncbi:MAG: hypothetical protein R3F41_05170 [Gammaproteobacteria bacterium]|nr:hypothetical protein [Pseudomonadales bacterium]
MNNLRQLLPPCTIYAILLFVILVAIPDLLLAATLEAGGDEIRFLDNAVQHTPAGHQAQAINHDLAIENRAGLGANLEWVIVSLALTALLASNLRHLVPRSGNLPRNSLRN